MGGAQVILGVEISFAALLVVAVVLVYWIRTAYAVTRSEDVVGEVTPVLEVGELISSHVSEGASMSPPLATRSPVSESPPSGALNFAPISGDHFRQLKIPPSKYYAVRRGRVPGIYSTWIECKRQVDGFAHARYKSFFNLQEAEVFPQSTC